MLDASALFELLLESKTAQTLIDRVLAPGQTMHAPELIDIEVAHAIRRHAHQGHINADRGSTALGSLVHLPIHRYPHLGLLSRIWELRHNLTAYDAAYVALAESLDMPLVTRDAALAGASGHRATIELVPAA